ncbi:MAG: 1-acyl-sn-glycerol-3-phosphate acyltransferase [Verrucomicrobia bacterium]|nr:1-acyl-sn-glycerol-3-phosphate acyltransferase [Verrucomicrobiota bacterium]
MTPKSPRPADANDQLERAARMTWAYRTAWWLSRQVARWVYRTRVEHVDRIPPLGPAILASNHASLADPPLIGGSVPRAVCFLARDTLFQIPLLGWYIRRLNAVPVNRDGGGGAGLKAILDRLQAGSAILLFPEGTRSADGRLGPARSGIGLTVIKSGAPVIPIRLHGTYEAWGRHRRLPGPGRFRVVVGEPLQFEALRAEARTCDKDRLKAIYREVADTIMARIAEL